MCAMSPRLLRPIASGVHPEAADWRARVIANGGTVSGSTLKAVSRLCTSISSAGIRDRFYRLNLFCGDNLNAALVPLYRGPTFGGTTYGNTTDTNVGGLFVSGDYSEGVGLSMQTNGTKYLDTGVQTAAMPQGVIDSGHLSVWHGPITVVQNLDCRLIGAHDSAGPHRATLIVNVNATPAGEAIEYGRTGLAAAPAPAAGNRPSTFLLGQRTSATNLELWKHGSIVAANSASTTGIAGIPYNIFVFRWNATGTVAGSNIATSLRHYSIGDDMTSDQVVAFRSALLALNDSLGRTA